MLEIQAPIGSGFKNITFYALNGVGFTQNGDTITGDPTRVILVSEEIASHFGILRLDRLNVLVLVIIDLPVLSL